LAEHASTRRAIAATCALFGAATCARPAPPPPEPQAQPPQAVVPVDAGGAGVEIQVETGPCFGTCAVYSVTLRADGTVDYYGESFVAVRGHQTARVSPSAVSDLVSSFDAAGFDTLTWHVKCPEKFVTDHSTLRTTLRHGGQAHSVLHNLGDGCPPPELVLLEAQVMRVVEPAIRDFIHCDGPCAL
jgi:hypothetical protein